MATSLKLKIITEIRAKRRQDGNMQHGATAVTWESRVAQCFIREKHLTSIANNNFYVLLGCRSYMANDVVYVDILDETKVSSLLCYITLQNTRS